MLRAWLYAVICDVRSMPRTTAQPGVGGWRLGWQCRCMAGGFRRALLGAVSRAPRSARTGTYAGWRATGAEKARGMLAEEQAALRRVATLVASDRSPAEVFAAVSEEAGKLFCLDSAHLLVYDRDETATVVGSWGLLSPVTPVGTQAPLHGDNVLSRVFHTQRPARDRSLRRRRRRGGGLRPRYGSSRGRWSPDPGRRADLGGDDHRLIGAGAAAGWHGAADRSVHRARRHGDRERRGA